MARIFLVGYLGLVAPWGQHLPFPREHFSHSTGRGTLVLVEQQGPQVL